MNKTYRIIWNKARKCLMVVGENVKSGGKSNGGKKALVDAVALAILSLGPLNSFAQSSSYIVPLSPSGPFTTGSITLGSGDTLTVLNRGTISAPTGPAVSNLADATIGFISNSGSIGGGNEGIALTNSSLSGGITNASNAIISGIDNSGIHVNNSSAIDFIANNGGTIIGGITGIAFNNSSIMSGGITNSGSIAGNYGIVISNAAISGGIINATAGRISGNAGVGIWTTNNANVDFISNNGGTIWGANTGVVLYESTITGGITNSGTIVGDLYGAVVVSQSTVSGGIKNAGSISAGAHYDGLYLRYSTISGGIVNGGTINGARTGIGLHIATSSRIIGGIINSGSIAGGAAGVYINGGSTVDFITNNNGTIIGGHTGVALIESTLAGTILNTGLIQGTASLRPQGTGILLAGSFSSDIRSGIGSKITGSIVNQGSIIGSIWGIGLLSNSVISGNIQNTGLISGSVAGLVLSGTAIAAGITNSGTIQSIAAGVTEGSSASSGSGIYFSAGTGSVAAIGSIVNQNLIQGIGGDATGKDGLAGAGYGVAIDGATVFNMSYSQYGSHQALQNSSLGTIQGVGGNANGSMSVGGNGYGVALLNNSWLSNYYIVGSLISNNGLIQGKGGAVIGDGAIAGNGVAFYEDANSRAGWNYFYQPGVIQNNGSLVGKGGDAQGLGAQAGSGIGIEIANGGRFGNGGIYNAKLISGIGGNASGFAAMAGGGYGIAVQGNGTVQGAINNSGIIQGIVGGTSDGAATPNAGYGIYIGMNSVVTGGISNSGLIQGSTHAIYIDPTASVSGIAITGNNSASFSGDVYAPHTSVTVAGAAAYALNNSFTVSGFSNEGTMILSPESNATIVGGSGAGSASFNQANSGTLQVGVNTISDGGYGQLYIDGNSMIGGTVNVSLSGHYSGIAAGSTIVGVVVDSGSMTTISGFNVSSNSAKLTFAGVISGGELNLVASNSNGCYGTVSANASGPCLVGFDSPSIKVNPGITISSDSVGIKVLPGLSDGALASGFGINNQGVIESLIGIALQAGSTLTGGITNAGAINGSSRGIMISAASLSGGLGNSGVISGAQGVVFDYSKISGSIDNGGSIGGRNAALNIGATTLEGIFNFGTMTASNGSAINVAASSVNGQIFNSGSISGSEAGVVVWDGSTVNGGVANSGSIQGAVSGIFIQNSSLYEGLANSGSIQGAASGIFIQSSSLYGGLRNTGTIIGGRSGFFKENGLITDGIINAGVIRGGNAGAGFSKDFSGDGSYSFGGYTGNGLFVSGDNAISSFVNSGSIQGIGSDVQTSYSGSGSFYDVAGGYARGAYLQLDNANVSIANTGLIKALGGIAINNGTVTQVIGSFEYPYLGLYVEGGTSSAIELDGHAKILNNAGSIIGIGGFAALSGSISQIFNADSLANGRIDLNSYGGQSTGLTSYLQDQSDVENLGGIGGFGGGSTISNLQVDLDSRSSLAIVSQGGGGTGAIIYLYGTSVAGGLTNAGTITGYGGTASIAGILSQSPGLTTFAGDISVASQGGNGNGLLAYSNGSISIQNSGIIKGIGGDSIISNLVINPSLGSSLNINNIGGSGVGGHLFITNNISIVDGLLNTGTIGGYGGNVFSSIGGEYAKSQAINTAIGGQGLGVNLLSYSALGVWGGDIVNKSLIEGIGGSSTSLNSEATTSGGLGMGLKLSAISSYYGSGLLARLNTIKGVVSNIGTIQGIGANTNGGVLATGGGGFGIYLGDDQVNCSTYCGNSTITGALINSALIHGVGGNATGTTVIGGNGYGVALFNGSQIEGGISNSGVIKGIGGNASGHGVSGDGYGIYVDAMSAVTGGINNSGTIMGLAGSILGGASVGNSYAIYAPSGGLTFINISGVNARIIGDVYAPNATFTVQAGANFTNNNSFNVNHFDIQNGGTFNFVNTVGVSHSVADGITAGNNVVNAGNLNIGTFTPTIAGNYVQSNTGTFSASVASQAIYGRLNVTGTASIAGMAAVTILNPATIMAGGSTLAGVITASTLTGTFSQVSTNGSSLYSFIPVYTDNGFNLAVSAVPILSQIVIANNNPAALGSATVLDGFINNPTVNPNMAPVLDRLSSISGTAGGTGVSNAISQTLPALVGAGSLVASQTQQGLSQIMQGRQNQLRGLSSGEEYIGNRNAWMKGYGSWANQNNLNNVSGYKVNTGGLAVGVDWELSVKANIGAVFAFGNSSVSSGNSAAPSGITVNSYQLGAYGDYAIRPDIQVNYQADFGFNNNKEYRNLSDFNGVQGVSSSASGVNANGNYNSYVGHVGTGLRKFISLSEDTNFTPSVRVDYTSVQSQGYTETGAGTLNLSVNSQSYNALLTSADLRIDRMFADKFKLSANIGAGYNALNNQVQMTTAFQGGGPVFSTNGLQTSPWLYNAGLGASGNISKDVELNIRYDSQFSTSGYTNQLVSAKLKLFY